MKAFNKKFTEKLSKLSHEQIENIVDSLSNENKAMFSILNSLKVSFKRTAAFCVSESIIQYSPSGKKKKSPSLSVWPVPCCRSLQFQECQVQGCLQTRLKACQHLQAGYICL